MNSEELKFPVPHKSRLSPDSPHYETIINAHETACLNGKENYKDPKTGYFVFTVIYLKKRGFCCNSGCRHCPYI